MPSIRTKKELLKAIKDLKLSMECVQNDLAGVMIVKDDYRRIASEQANRADKAEATLKKTEQQWSDSALCLEITNNRLQRAIEAIVMDMANPARVSVINSPELRGDLDAQE